MQSARVTILMTPEKKASIEGRASKLGVSSGEFIRLAVDNFDAGEDRAMLDALITELRETIPQMAKSFELIEHDLAVARSAVDAALRTTGGRA